MMTVPRLAGLTTLLVGGLLLTIVGCQQDPAPKSKEEPGYKQVKLEISGMT